MKAKLIKREDGLYSLYDENGKIIYGKLSLKNCQAIENGYDLDEILNDYIMRRPFMRIDKKHQKMYKEGFQKALEILGDKKFSEEDMRYAWEYGNSLGVTGGAGPGDFENYLHREYPQYYEWDVEIEMEFVEEEQTGTHLVWGRTTPKLDADGCLILKRI